MVREPVLYTKNDSLKKGPQTIHKTVNKKNSPVDQCSMGFEEWGVIGRVCKSSDVENTDKGVCNRVAASEIRIRLAFATKVKDIIGPEKVLLVLETDFVESRPK